MNDEKASALTLAHLRALTRVAIQRSAEQDPDSALAAYREATAICAEAGLRAEEAFLWLTIAGTAMDAEEYGSAFDGYLRSIELAAECRSFILSYLGWMSVARVFLAIDREADALDACRQAADAALVGGLEGLRINALLLPTLFNAIQAPEASAMAALDELAALAASRDAEKEDATTRKATAVLEGLTERLGLPRDHAARLVEGMWLLGEELATWMITATETSRHRGE